MEDVWESLALRQFRGRFVDNLLQKIEDSLRATGLVGAVAVERELADGELHERQAYAPDIRLDGVLSALNALRCHVRAGSHKGVGDRALQFAGNTEIAQLDLAPGIDQHVGGFDVAMHDAMGAPEVRQAAEDGFGDFAENVDADGAKVLRNGIQRAASGQKGRVTGDGTYPLSMYSMHMTTSLTSFKKAPKKETM